jgi:hypothetical protein
VNRLEINGQRAPQKQLPLDQNLRRQSRVAIRWTIRRAFSA